MKNRIQFAALLFVLPFYKQAYATEVNPSVNEALYYYCHQGSTVYEEMVTVGNGTKVMHHQGPFMQINTTSDHQKVMDLVKNQLKESGVSSHCAQYLLNYAEVDFQGEWREQLTARVLFDFDKSKLNNQSRFLLNQVRERVKQGDTDLVIVGSSDSKGASAYNYALGLKRSQAVSHYLAVHDVDEQQLTSYSDGEERPVSSNDTAQGRRMNRRVDIRLESQG